MNTLRRIVVACTILGGLIASPVLAGWLGFGSGIKMYEVTLKIRDEAGNPIPYASIWYADQRENTHPLGVLDAADLWRIANRLMGESYEFVNDSVKPYPSLGISPMSNKRGTSLTKFPERKQLTAYEAAFVILKRGYQPAKVVTSIATGGDDQALTVTLQPDPSSCPVPRYLEEFDRIRYENTSIDIRDSGQVSSVSSLIQQLNELADEALRVGDKESATKILFYISYLPSASPGRAQSVDYFSPQSAPRRTDKINSALPAFAGRCTRKNGRNRLVHRGTAWRLERVGRQSCRVSQVCS